MKSQNIIISKELCDEMISYHLGCLPDEGCGLLAGYDLTARVFLPVENILHSSNRFSMKPEEQLRAFKQIEEQNMDLIAIVHSHPDGVTSPSAIDCDKFAYPGVLSVIIAALECGAILFCYKIENKSWTSVDIEYN